LSFPFCSFQFPFNSVLFIFKILIPVNGGTVVKEFSLFKGPHLCPEKYYTIQVMIYIIHTFSSKRITATTVPDGIIADFS
jgi:hypothetical protein